MKPNILTLTISILVLGHTFADGEILLDQFSTGEVTSGIASPQDFAQTFTVGIEGTLNSVALLYSEVGTPIIEIRETVGGLPVDSPPLGLVNVGFVNAPSPPVWRHIDFSAFNIPVEPGDVLAIVLKSVSDTHQWNLGVDNYDRGISYRRPRDSTEPQDWAIILNERGFVFRAFVEPIPEPSSIVLAGFGFVVLLLLTRRLRHKI